MSSRTQEQAAKRAAARQAEQQAAARRRSQVRIVALSAVLVVAGGAVALTLTGDDDRTDGGAQAAGAVLTSAPPWPAQKQGLAERVADLGFPPVGDESYHAHALLSVYRNGEQVPVPADLGFDARGAHTSLHTHTPDGVIHLEADDPYPYELSHVFQTWGVAFDRDRLGGDVAEGDKRVHVYVNGEPAPDGPVVIEDGDNIVVAYGTDGSFPTEPATDALDRA